MKSQCNSSEILEIMLVKERKFISDNDLQVTVSEGRSTTYLRFTHRLWALSKLCRLAPGLKH